MLPERHRGATFLGVQNVFFWDTIFLGKQKTFFGIQKLFSGYKMFFPGYNSFWLTKIPEHRTNYKKSKRIQNKLKKEEKEQEKTKDFADFLFLFLLV